MSEARRRQAAPHPVLEQANLALQMRNVQAAEQLAASVLKSDRGNARAAQLLGRALMMQGRAQDAIAPLERALRRTDDPAITTDLAIALAAGGRRDDALARLREAITRQPPYAPAFLEYGAMLAKGGSFDDAVAVLERGIGVAPEMADLRMELGFVHLKRNDRAGARARFEEVMAMAPERYDALPALGRTLALDGDYAAAIDLFRRALALRPDDAMTRSNLGACLLEAGERETGEAALRSAVRTAPPMVGQAITALAAASHGRFFLKRSAAAKYLSERG